MNPYIEHNGDRAWYNKAGELHREDGPALIYANGNRRWLKNGNFHRLDGPALVYTDGTHKWYVNDQRCYNANEFQERSNQSDEVMTFLLLQYGDIR